MWETVYPGTLGPASPLDDLQCVVLCQPPRTSGVHSFSGREDRPRLSVSRRPVRGPSEIGQSLQCGRIT